MLLLLRKPLRVENSKKNYFSVAYGLDNALKKPAGGTALAGDNVGIDSV